MAVADLEIIPIHGFSSDANGNITVTEDKYVVDFTDHNGTMYLIEFQDNFDPRYSVTNTFGRMDPIVNYQGTSRKISTAIQLRADADSGIDLHTKMKKIVSNLNMKRKELLF